MSAAVTHRPGLGGLFDTSALCGASLADGDLRMHVYEYDCPECKRLSGEHVATSSASGVNAGRGASYPSCGADDAPDEAKGALRQQPPAPLAGLRAALALGAVFTIAVLLAVLGARMVGAL